jgi:hypothetical protein
MGNDLLGAGAEGHISVGDKQFKEKGFSYQTLRERSSSPSTTSKTPCNAFRPRWHDEHDAPALFFPAIASSRVLEGFRVCRNRL